MPKVPNDFLRSVVFLYPTVDDASAGRHIGGTGFLISVPSNVIPTAMHTYVVSNWHVAAQSAPVVRVNKIGGGHDVFDIDINNWEFIPGSYDVAITPIVLNPNSHDFRSVPTSLFATSQVIQQLDIGPGENTFMCGRFIDSDGGETNVSSITLWAHKHDAA